MNTFKVLKTLFIVGYIVILSGAIALPLYVRALEPYAYGPGGGSMQVRGLLWGQFGYAKVLPLTIVVSAVYWFVVAMVLAAYSPKDIEADMS